jgi:ABC-type transport system involved in multi-copper enzyme maturation permease subunit
MLLVKDELWGFAKSKVMLVLWVIMPIIAILGYFILPSGAVIRGSFDNNLSATAFMALLESSIAGTVAALMVAVDIVSEKNRKVYELYVIRPIKRDAIILSKFVAVFVCVSVACVVSILLGITVDTVRGDPVSGEMIYDLVKSLTSLTAVIALSAAIGVFFGVTTKTILVAVILILYVGQNVAVIPMLPMYFGILPNAFWLFMLISGALVAMILFASCWLFRRTEF